MTDHGVCTCTQLKCWVPKQVAGARTGLTEVPGAAGSTEPNIVAAGPMDGHECVFVSMAKTKRAGDLDDGASDIASDIVDGASNIDGDEGTLVDEGASDDDDGVQDGKSGLSLTAIFKEVGLFVCKAVAHLALQLPGFAFLPSSIVFTLYSSTRKHAKRGRLKGQCGDTVLKMAVNVARRPQGQSALSR